MAASLGARRERQVRAGLEADDWVVLRAAGSLGPVDLVALKRGVPPQLIQVKSDRLTPWKNFAPAARRQLSTLALHAGAEAWLYWWPPHGRLKPIHSDDWPSQ